jgi:hypothetical protein
MIFYEAGISHYLPIDKTNKMKAAKILYQSSTDYDRYFVFESIYNWNESRDSFMKAYNEGIDKGSTMATKQ